MAGVSNLAISGAASGLDTQSIIDSLVKVQANQQTLLKTRQSTYQKTADAYKTLMTSLTSLSDQAKSLANTSAWKGLAATSTSTSVTATATGTSTGSLAFDVTAVAARHALVSAEGVGTTTSVVASGPLTLTKSDGTTTSIDVGSGSLDDVVAGINAAKAGITASAVQTSPGQYRLQVTSTTYGEASQFTLGGLDGFSAMNTLATGADAKIHVGDALTGYDITSSTNTFKDVVPGLSFTVSKLETGVTVSSAADGSAVATDVQALVDAANKVLADIATKTTWDSQNKTGGPLTGESAVRNLTQSILSTVGGAGAAGVSLTRDGKLAFDKQAFVDAFAADPKAVAAQFGASVSFAKSTGVTGNVSLARASDTAQPGTYAVEVTSAPLAEQWQVDVTGGTVEGQLIELTKPGGGTFSYTAPTGETLADTVTKLNTRLAAAGFGVGASVSGGNIVFTATGTGSGGAFVASLDGSTQTQLVAGQDVAGSIDGQTATGAGSVLSLNTGTGGAVGLSLTVGVTAADVTTSGGSVGSVTYSQGMAQKLATLLADATGTGGALTSAKSSSDNQVKDLQEQIDKWDNRLETFRAMLTTQFTAMETAIQKLKSSSSFLSSYSSTQSSSSSSNG